MRGRCAAGKEHNSSRSRRDDDGRNGSACDEGRLCGGWSAFAQQGPAGGAGWGVRWGWGLSRAALTGRRQVVVSWCRPRTRPDACIDFCSTARKASQPIDRAPFSAWRRLRRRRPGGRGGACQRQWSADQLVARAREQTTRNTPHNSSALARPLQPFPPPLRLRGHSPSSAEGFPRVYLPPWRKARRSLRARRPRAAGGPGRGAARGRGPRARRRSQGWRYRTEMIRSSRSSSEWAEAC